MSGRLLAIIVATAFAAAAVLGASLWLAYPLLQLKRADAKTFSANSHIETANRQLADTEFEDFQPGYLISPENITRSQELLAGAQPALKEAAHEVDLAGDDMEAASTLSKLPPWYHDYLEKKRESAIVRQEQITEITALAMELERFYNSAAPLLKAIEDMDRLQGQLMSAAEMSQTRPDEAIATLEQLQGSFEQIRRDMDSQGQQSGFKLFTIVADAAAASNTAAGLVARFAAAAKAGDQAEAQRASGELDDTFTWAVRGHEAIDTWWDEDVKPHIDKFDELQRRLEELDDEARVLYRERD